MGKYGRYTGRFTVYVCCVSKLADVRETGGSCFAGGIGGDIQVLVLF